MMIRLAALLVALVALATGRLAAQEPGAPADSITLQPGDMVQVTIWREKDLSGIFPVDEHGIATLPLLGERKVTDIPIGRLRQELTEAYRVELRNPSITVTPLRRIFVLGAVKTPGTYTVAPTSTVLSVIADAEGTVSGGSMDRIEIVRDASVIAKRVSPASRLSDLGILSGDQIVVGQRSWLARNQGLVISVLLAIPSVVYTITRIN